jgi:hypothetical protein
MWGKNFQTSSYVLLTSPLTNMASLEQDHVFFQDRRESGTTRVPSTHSQSDRYPNIATTEKKYRDQEQCFQTNG